MGASEPPSGIITALFSDVEGSTTLVQKLGDHSVSLFERHRALMRQAFAQHDGYEHQTEGDSFFVVFADPADAVAAALAAQRALTQERWSAAEIRVRIGVHTGAATWRDGDYWGIGIHEAARVAAVGHGGQIVVSATTAAAVADALPVAASLRDLGVYRLKDLTEPQRLFQLDHPDLPAEFPALRTLDFHAHNLPTQRTPLLGRNALLAELEARLAAERLLTLTGVGGTGKTRLALQLAANHIHDFSDGAFFVDLAVVADPDLVALTTAQAIGVPQSGTSGDSLADLVAYVATRDILIILDNCEHVLDAASAVADALVDRAPGVRLLVTSREPLGVDGEAIIRVPSLDTSDADSSAARLFRDRAARAGAQLATDAETAEAIAQVVRRLDGVPLAIELAAARCAEVPLATVARLLDDRFRLLTGGARKAQQRHQTMLATVEWSHNLLTATEQALFRRLAVFPGSFDTDAAIAVCSPDDPLGVVDGLGSLVSKSLVSFDGARYRLLETLRLFAQARLADAGEADDCRVRHVEWTVSAAGDLVVSDLERIFVLLDDVRAALSWCEGAGDVHRGVRVVTAASGIWFTFAISDEALPWFERARGIDASLPLDERLAWRVAEYWVTLNTVDIPRMVALATEMAELDPDMRTAAGVSAGWTRAMVPGVFNPGAGIAELDALQDAPGWKTFSGPPFIGGIPEPVLVGKAALQQLAGRFDEAVATYESGIRPNVYTAMDYCRIDKAVALALAGRAADAIESAADASAHLHPRAPHFTVPAARAAAVVALAASGDIPTAAQRALELLDLLARDYARSDTARGFAHAAVVALCRFGALRAEGAQLVAGASYHGYNARWMGALALFRSSEALFARELGDAARAAESAGYTMSKDELWAFARSVAERLARA